MEHEETATAGSIAFPLPKKGHFSVGSAKNRTNFCLSTFLRGRRSGRKTLGKAANLHSSTIRACGKLLETQSLL
jgi:hypothetical protein